MNYSRIISNLYWGEKVPRKAKKTILGKLMKKKDLKIKLRDFKIVKPSKTMYETPETNIELFCPKCGCEYEYGTGNMAEYPEHWEIFKCLRCKFQTGLIDNSPYYHALEFKEYNYEIN